MQELGGRRPSPALVISIVALVAALGGTAWAAHKVGSGEIKAGAITAAKIKREAVTTAKLGSGAVVGAKIAPNSVTGAQIDESSLATVPDADHTATANRAASAATADRAATAAGFDRYASSPIVTAAIGGETTIMQRGPFTFVGHCANGGGGAAEASVTASTSEAGATFSNPEGSHSHADFDPGEENPVGPPIASIDGATNDNTGGNSADFTALSSDGQIRLSGEAFAAVNYFGAPCAFWGWTMENGAGG